MLTLSRAAILLGLLACRGVCQDVPESSTKPSTAESALRERAAQFFQFHVDGKLRQAYELVAAGSRDSWFASVKPRMESFKITGVEFSKSDPTQALVDIESIQKIQVQSGFEVVLVPMTTWWKIENGEWMWCREIRPASR